MIIKTVIRKGEYYDSVKLMIVSKKLTELEGIAEAAVQMGTELNKEVLKRTGMLDEISETAAADDLMISIKGSSDEAAAKALEQLDKLLEQRGSEGMSEYMPKTVDSALKAMPGLNFSIISVPGHYAKDEAMKVMRNGMHVLLFSDNVTLEEEIELKKYSVENGLLLMGPDCGTAMLNNIPLGFANKVRQGNIGIVGAAGTGMQEVMSLVHRYGGGISQAIGTGGRDLSISIGGATMLQGLEALNADPGTEIIVIISKPPAPEIADKVMNYVKQKCNKPVILNFIGTKFKHDNQGKTIVTTLTLEETAKQAVKLAGVFNAPGELTETEINGLAKQEASKLAEEQKYLRGLYSGGTLCYESMLILRDYIGDIYSNTPLNKNMKLANVYKTEKNSCLDLGDDEFTFGRAHPMIDTALRETMFEEIASDPSVAVILLDIVIGCGVHSDPAQVFAKLIRKHKKLAEAAGRHLVVITSVCGTPDDPQNALLQQKQLEEAGAIVMTCNALTAKLAGKVLSEVIK